MMSDYEDYYDEGPPDYNQVGKFGEQARAELVAGPSCAPICTLCGQRHTQRGLWAPKWADTRPPETEEVPIISLFLEGPYVPHTEWTCVETEDNGEGVYETCQMCQHEQIRYVQIMTHWNWMLTHDETDRVWNKKLRCGCICAGHMEGDMDAALARDAEMKRVAQQKKKEKKRLTRLQEAEAEHIAWRRDTWLDKGNWRVTQAGNDWRQTTHGFRIVIVSNGFYGARVSKGHHVMNVPCNYTTSTAAKIAAFDAMTQLDNILKRSPGVAGLT